MSLANCIRSIPIDPADLAEIRRLVEAEGDEAKGIQTYLAGLEGDLDSVYKQVRAKGEEPEIAFANRPQPGTMPVNRVQQGQPKAAAPKNAERLEDIAA